MIKSAFFYQTVLPRSVARTASKKVHEASPKSANMKTQSSTPTSKLSVGLQNVNKTSKLSKDMSCLESYLYHLPLPAFLGAFAKLRKATLSFFMSVRPSFRLAVRMGKKGLPHDEFS
jgi:hypothetical protein